MRVHTRRWGRRVSPSSPGADVGRVSPSSPGADVGGVSPSSPGADAAGASALAHRRYSGYSLGHSRYALGTLSTPGRDGGRNRAVLPGARLRVGVQHATLQADGRRVKMQPKARSMQRTSRKTRRRRARRRKSRMKRGTLRAHMQLTMRSRDRAADNVQPAADDVHTTTMRKTTRSSNPTPIGSVSMRAATCARKAGRHRDRTSSSFVAAAGTCAIPCPKICTFTRLCATAGNMQETMRSRCCDSAHHPADIMQRMACSGRRAIDDMRQATRGRQRARKRHHVADHVQPTTLL